MISVTTVLIAVLSFVLGMALNRGSTCAVLATEEMILHRRPERFLAFFEAAMWAAICLTLIGAFPLMRLAWGGWGEIVLGAAMFGIGAVVNGACPFGVVGRIGSGQVEFLLTGFGLWLGTVAMALTADMSMPIPTVKTGLGAPIYVYPVILAVLLVLRLILGRHRKPAFLRLTGVMAVVGASFVTLAYLHQPFPWVNALAALPKVAPLPALALVCLLAGSASNAAIDRGIRFRAPTTFGSSRRVVGGTLMGAGAVLVPGGNDSLLLYGLPQGSAQAFVAYVIIVALVAATILVSGRVTAAWKGLE